MTALRLAVGVTPENRVLIQIIEMTSGEERAAIAFDPPYAVAASRQIRRAAMTAARRAAAH